MKTADFFVDRLKAWGVQRIFGYSGDGINGVIGAIQRDEALDFVQPRHEEMAAFMAVAHAKFTGELGVCLATGGPGATHLITGLYDARADASHALLADRKQVGVDDRSERALLAVVVALVIRERTPYARGATRVR